MVSTPFPEPDSTPDLRGLLLHYLDFYRDVVISKIDALGPEELQQSAVPSGWTAAGLVNHLANVERRWMRWGFAAEALPDPWRDDAGGGWVSPRVEGAVLVERLRQAGLATRQIAERHALTDRAATGGRFTEPASAPHLQWILLHLIQEYARHAGHLDIWRELHDGAVGESP